jgi:starvation-inducible DNA-binding protein
MAKETVNIGLTAEQREGAAGILNGLLADEHVIYIKSRNFHWNVTGPEFHDLHEVFEEQYEQIAETIDEIAERVRALGETPLGSMAEFLAATRLKEATGARTAGEMIAELTADHEALIRRMREDLETIGEKFHDAGNQDAITGWMKQHEKMAWMLRSMRG